MSPLLSAAQLLSAARSAAQLGLFAESRELYRRLLAAEPSHREAQLGLDLLDAPAAGLSLPALAFSWQNGPELPECWEADWLRYVLSGLPIEDVKGGPRAWPASSPALIVDHRLRPDKLEGYRKLFHAGIRFGLIHLSDELYADDRSAYAYASLVLRNYWSPELAFDRRVLTLPLGWKTGFAIGQPTPSSEQRRYRWCFVGSFRKSQRQPMLRALAEVPGGFQHLTQEFDAPDALSIGDYRAVLCQSVFCPAPAGHANLDSFRVWEALECGAIPIVEKRPGFDYFRLAYGDHPMPTVQSWSEAPVLIARLIGEPARVEALRLACSGWWSAYKRELRARVARLVGERLFGSAPR